jgi:hypothetical protein
METLAEGVLAEQREELKDLTEKLVAASRAEMEAVIAAREKKFALDNREYELLTDWEVPGKNERIRDAHIQRSLEGERRLHIDAEAHKTRCQYERQAAEQRLRTARLLFEAEGNQSWQPDNPL